MKACFHGNAALGDSHQLCHKGPPGVHHEVDIIKKTENRSQNDKTEHGMEKNSAKIKAKSPKMMQSQKSIQNESAVKPEPETERILLNVNLYPSDGPGKPKKEYL
ncbi:hypothetical protein Tco_0212778 [Tanacetum coccineum]